MRRHRLGARTIATQESMVRDVQFAHGCGQFRLAIYAEGFARQMLEIGRYHLSAFTSSAGQERHGRTGVKKGCHGSAGGNCFVIRVGVHEEDVFSWDRRCHTGQNTQVTIRFLGKGSLTIIF